MKRAYKILETNKGAMFIGIVTLVASLGINASGELPAVGVVSKTEMDFEITVAVKNNGTGPAYDIPLKLALPIDNPPGQYVKRIEILQRPERRTRDTEGNRFVYYNIDVLEPGSEKNFTFDISLELITSNINLKGAELNGENLSRYLSGDELSEVSDPDIQRIAKDIRNASGNPREIAYNTYSWVIGNIAYERMPGEAGAKEALQRGKGDSAELSNLFVALMRANGIPARRVSGLGNHFEENQVLRQEDVAHGWAEIYLGGWVPADPTFGRTDRFLNFARTDAEHVVMTVGAEKHFMTRGMPAKGEGADLSTDYMIRIKNIVMIKDVNSADVWRKAIAIMIIAIPLIFLVLIIRKGKR